MMPKTEGLLIVHLYFLGILRDSDRTKAIGHARIIFSFSHTYSVTLLCAANFFLSRVERFRPVPVNKEKQRLNSGKISLFLFHLLVRVRTPRNPSEGRHLKAICDCEIRDRPRSASLCGR